MRFRDFGRRPGWEIDLKQVGYLFVLTQPSDVEEFERSVALQNELGLDSRMLAGEERARFARCSTATTCSPERSRPATATRRPRAWSRGTRSPLAAYGAHIRVGCEVRAIVATAARSPRSSRPTA